LLFSILLIAKISCCPRTFSLYTSLSVNREMTRIDEKPVRILFFLGFHVAQQHA
jgi:hypothetical protein